MDESKTCCFTGHRKLPKEQIEQIMKRLNFEVDKLIAKGVTDFVSGGAPGFDLLASSLIIAKKEMGENIRLIFLLPCKNHEELWQDQQRTFFQNLLAEADEVIYLKEAYYEGCAEERDCNMVNRSSYCICALAHPFGSTKKTIRYAREKHLHIINVAE